MQQNKSILPCFAVQRGIRSLIGQNIRTHLLQRRKKNTGEVEAARINEGRKDEFKKELQEQINEEGNEGGTNEIFNTRNLMYCA
jgi:hypothetical protein